MWIFNPVFILDKHCKHSFICLTTSVEIEKNTAVDVTISGGINILQTTQPANFRFHLYNMY